MLKLGGDLRMSIIHFIGGDLRDIYLFELLKKQGYEISTLWGFDKLGYSQFSIKALKNTITKNSTIIFPMSGTSVSGEVKAKYSTEPIIITEEFFKILPEGTKLLIGYARPWFREYCHKYNIDLLEVAEDDELAILNSIPSAEGAIQLAMENSEKTIHGSKILVIGLGRCGMTLARMLKNLDAKVYVSVRNPANEARAYEMGFTPVMSGQENELLNEFDYIFNTVPNLMLPEEKLKLCTNIEVIVDIASPPGGVDFDFAKNQGIKAILAPGLPGMVAPKTAADILAKVYPKFLRRDNQ